MLGDLRTPEEHDVDRILYSTAFRRLAGVTQVVAVDEVLLFHNRLTHTIKVAQLARRLAEDLNREERNRQVLDNIGGVNISSAEAAALAHDLGHPPFGHIAEEILCQRCDEAGADGFEGNAQSFRIVTKLARRAGDAPGLGLTPRTLRAILKYPWMRGPKPATEDKTERLHHRKWGAYLSEQTELEEALGGDTSAQQSAEAAIMDWSDDISYALHDLEDFFRADMIPLARVGSLTDNDEAMWFLARADHELAPNPRYTPDGGQAAFKKLRGYFPAGSYRGSHEDDQDLHTMTNKFITRYFDAVSLHSAHPLVRTNIAVQHEVMLLKQLTWQYVVNGPALATMQRGQTDVINELFTALDDWLKDEEKRGAEHRLPTRLRMCKAAMQEDHALLDSLPTPEARRARVIADYLCCLTEDQTLDLYRRIKGHAATSILEGWVRW